MFAFVFVEQVDCDFFVEWPDDDISVVSFLQ